MLESGSGPLARKPHLNTRTESHQGGRKSSGGAFSTSNNSQKKGTMGPNVPNDLQSTTSSISSSFVVKDGMLPQFLHHYTIITSNMFVLNMVNHHHLKLRCCLPLLSNFKQINIMATTAYHPVIQKEVDELLAKDAI